MRVLDVVEDPLHDLGEELYVPGVRVLDVVEDPLHDLGEEGFIETCTWGGGPGRS